MHYPRIRKGMTRSARVALHHAKGSSCQGKVTACFNQQFQQLIIPEGHNHSHEYLFVEPEFEMAGGKPDLTIQVSIGAENCPSADVFAAVFHESKPNLVKSGLDETGAQNFNPYIQQASLVDAAGKQLVKRLKDRTNWELVTRTQWDSVYGTSGIGEWFALFQRKLEDRLTYHIYRNPGDPVLRKQVQPDDPDRQYFRSLWTRIEEGDFFEIALSSVGEDIVDQTLSNEIAFLA